MFDIDKALQAISERYTPEQRADDETMQIARRAEYPAQMRPDAPEAIAARANAQEQDIAAQITMLTQEPESELKAARLNQALDRLSELLAAQGHYATAIEVTPNEDRRAYYQNILEAINRPNQENCDCAGDFINRQMRSPNVVSETIISADGKPLTVYQCAKCGFLNAR